MSDPISLINSERDPSLEETIRRHVRGELRQMNFCLPGVVTAWDATLQKASVKPLVKRGYKDEEMQRKVESLVVCTGVAVQFMSAGGFAFTCPISDGSLVIEGDTIKATTGTLFFSDLSLDRWLQGTGSEVDPAIDRMHSQSDAIFIPGLNPFGNPLPGVPSDHAVLGYLNGILLHLHKGLMTVAENGNEASADFVALAGKVLSELTSIASATHTHQYLLAPGTPTTATPTGPASIGYTAPIAEGDIASSNFKTT